MKIKKTSKFDGSESFIDIEKALDDLDGNYKGTRAEIKEMLFEVGILQTPFAYYEVG